jgi:hypothetical protein
MGPMVGNGRSARLKIARGKLDIDRFWSWLCENAKILSRDRRSYSFKTAFGLQFANALNLEIELKNFILVAFRLFAFLHSQGQNAKNSR